MAGYRIDRVSEDIKREIIAVIRELKDPRVMDKMLTVVRVEVSSDGLYPQRGRQAASPEENSRA